MFNLRQLTGMVVVVMVGALFCWSSVAAQEPDSNKKLIDSINRITDQIMDEVQYNINVKPYLNVDAFVNPRVDVESDLDGLGTSLDLLSMVGLDNSPLTVYLRLRLKNNCAGYPILTLFNLTNEVLDSLRGDKCLINIKVWTVGNEYPIACHIEMKCTITKFPIVPKDIDEAYTDAILGVCSPINAEESIKRGIDKLVERFAIKFLKAKGEI